MSFTLTSNLIDNRKLGSEKRSDLTFILLHLTAIIIKNKIKIEQLYLKSIHIPTGCIVMLVYECIVKLFTLWQVIGKYLVTRTKDLKTNFEVNDAF